MNWKELLSVVGLFLKLGAISFGGPASSIALIDEEVVRKRGWIDREHFLDLLAATNLVPGPNVVEMAIHIGQVRAGWWGFMVAGVAFILPAFLISLALSWIYVRLGTLPQGQALFYGINPAVMAIILVATYRLGKAALKGKAQILLGVLAFVSNRGNDIDNYKVCATCPGEPVAIRLTDEVRYAMWPAWSLDGSLLAYVDEPGGNLLLVKANRSDSTYLTSGVFGPPIWRPERNEK